MTLRDMRRRAGLTQAQLAQAADITPAYLSYLENGQRKNPGLATLQKLAGALQAPLAEVAGSLGERRPSTAEEDQIQSRTAALEPLFDDLRFAPGSTTRARLLDSEDVPARHLADERLFFRVGRTPDGARGAFCEREQALVLLPEAAGDDAALLHAMTHRFVSALGRLPSVYQDVAQMDLQLRLRGRMPDLEETLCAFARQAQKDGGEHGALFLLKSFELDLRFGWRLGAVYRGLCETT